MGGIGSKSAGSGGTSPLSQARTERDAPKGPGEGSGVLRGAEGEHRAESGDVDGWTQALHQERPHGEACAFVPQSLDVLPSRQSAGPASKMAMFQAAARAAVQKNKMDKGENSSEKMLAAMRLATEQAKIKGASSRQKFLEATKQAASIAKATLSFDEPEQLTPVDEKRLRKEFDAIDKERRGGISVQQLEKLFAKRAYYTRKEAWKEEERRKNKGKGWGAQTPVHGANFKYSGADNRKDRSAAILSSKSAFEQYGIGSEGMSFQTFCSYHLKVVARGRSSNIQDVSSWQICDTGTSSMDSSIGSFKSRSFRLVGASKIKNSQSIEEDSASMPKSPQSVSNFSASFDGFSRTISGNLPKMFRSKSGSMDSAEG
mmetsp:Transcript_5374/g.13755  ORF Transcript_5374/g.13755 Transcript_5374/m.13755 type:complete len:373 (+) Transcript_5374:2050-3168(+)